MGTFIPREILDMLSYQSALGQSLKQISLRETPLKIRENPLHRGRIQAVL